MDGDQLAGLVNDVTRTWSKKKKAEERSSRAPRVYYYSSRVTIKEAAYDAMQAAYKKASGGGRYYANARQIMYAARKHILDVCDADQLDDRYFTQTLLPDYINEHPEETAGWKVAYDARGSFIEPHEDGRNVALGTIDVERHLKVLGRHSVPGVSTSVSSGSGDQYPTEGPGDRYGAVLFVEKEGFTQALVESGITREYDLALMSTKGQSNIASRTLIEDLCGVRDLPLLILHDFDVAGFKIAATLGRSNRRYQWVHDPNAIDLGLRLKDVEEWSLESERVKSKKADRWGLREDGATAEEVEFLMGGQRVELNAFPTDQLLDWLRRKLDATGIKKVVPDENKLQDAYRRAIHVGHVERRFAELDLDGEGARVGEEAVVPANLESLVRAELEDNPEMTWDAAVSEVVQREQFGEDA